MALVVTNPPASAGNRRIELDPWVRKIPWSRKWQPTPVLLPRKSHGQKSLTGYSHGITKSQTWQQLSILLPQHINIWYSYLPNCFFTFHVSHLFYIYNSVFLPDRSDSLFFLLFFFFRLSVWNCHNQYFSRGYNWNCSMLT